MGIILVQSHGRGGLEYIFIYKDGDGAVCMDDMFVSWRGGRKIQVICYSKMNMSNLGAEHPFDEWEFANHVEYQNFMNRRAAMRSIDVRF